MIEQLSMNAIVVTKRIQIIAGRGSIAFDSLDYSNAPLQKSYESVT